MRKKKKIERTILPDPVYESALVTKFTNYLMVSGKKDTARKIIYKTLATIKEKTKKDPVEVFGDAINNVAPRVEVISRRIGGARYQIPKEVSGERKIALAMKWIISAARSAKGKPTYQALTAEILAAYKHEGEAMRKRKEVEKIAEANRAFAHFAW